MPYVGYQTYNISSPKAGQDIDPDVAQAQLRAVEVMETRNVVVGITLLRRLVPGWFIKADIGSDGANIGFAVEF